MIDEVIDGETFDIVEPSKEIQPISIPAKLDVDSAVEIYRAQREFVTRIMEADRDYGTVPGTNKPSLWKPGAEKFHRFYGFQVEVKISDKIEHWDTPITLGSFPLFNYTYLCEVKDRGDYLIATAEGSCNSYESKYQWRWVNIASMPSKYNVDTLETRPGTESEFKFAVEKKETTGAYGKPVEYWDSWEKDIADGNAEAIKRKTRSGKNLDAYQRDSTVYRIPNEDIFSQVNTIMKMAQKRAYVGGIILASNASEYFTQDLEDTAIPQDEINIFTFVPDKDAAGRKIRRHVAKLSGLGIETAGYFVKYVLMGENIIWSLDNWNNIVELLEKEIKEKTYEKDEVKEWLNNESSKSSA